MKSYFKFESKIRNTYYLNKILKIPFFLVTHDIVEELWTISSPLQIPIHTFQMMWSNKDDSDFKNLKISEIVIENERLYSSRFKWWK